MQYIEKLNLLHTEINMQFVYHGNFGILQKLDAFGHKENLGYIGCEDDARLYANRLAKGSKFSFDVEYLD
jgi:hypothetical protein